jgi:hypothetical protein
MAKKGAISKTRAVLDYIKAHPGVGNKMGPVLYE